MESWRSCCKQGAPRSSRGRGGGGAGALGMGKVVRVSIDTDLQLSWPMACPEARHTRGQSSTPGDHLPRVKSISRVLITEQVTATPVNVAK